MKTKKRTKVEPVLKAYTIARAYFYTMKIRERAEVHKAVREAMYKVQKRHRKNVTGFRVFKSWSEGGKTIIERIN